MNKQKWKIREAKPNDIAFIYATWLKSYYGDSWTRGTLKTIFFNNYKAIIDHILSDPDVLVDVSCLPDHDNVILGYLVTNPEKKIAHYLFVKEAFRELGIARDLMLNKFPDGQITITHKTRSANSIIRAKSNLVFNPFLLYQGV